MNIDCCKSYVGKQIIGLLPSEQECLYYLVVNSQDFGVSDFTGWKIDGVDVYASGYYWYPNYINCESIIISYIGTQPTEVIFEDPFGFPYPFVVDKVTKYGGSCEKVCYQAEFDYGSILYYIDFYQLGGATTLVGIGINIDDEAGIQGVLTNLLGPDVQVSSVWNGSKYVVTINNAYNLGGLMFNFGLADETTFNVLPCEITPPTPVPLDLLSAYPGAAAAYSLRKISSTYSGAAIRVRRSSDNTESDIGFDSNGDLNETVLTTFVGANNGFVTKWYDQSGNNNHGLQTTAAAQPRIVGSGVIDKVNLKAAINFIFEDLFTLTSSISSTTDYSSFTVGRRPNSGQRLIYFGTSDNSYAPYVLDQFGDGKNYFANRNKYAYYSDASTNQVLLTSFSVSNNLSAYQNGVSKTLTIVNYSTFGNFNQIGRTGPGSGYNSTGYIQEIIFYSNDQIANRVGIETNIINYYSI